MLAHQGLHLQEESPAGEELVVLDCLKSCWPTMASTFRRTVQKVRNSCLGLLVVMLAHHVLHLQEDSPEGKEF